MSRYDEKPFLKLLDCYVLRAIGALDEKPATALTALEPQLVEAYGREGTWFDIVAAEMQFPDDLPDQIKAIWDKGKADAEADGLAVDPAQFTELFVDKNFLN